MRWKLVVWLLASGVLDGCAHRPCPAPADPSLDSVRLECDGKARVRALTHGALPDGMERVERESGKPPLFRVGTGPRADGSQHQDLYEVGGYRSMPGWRSSGLGGCDGEPCIRFGVHVCDADLKILSRFLEKRAAAGGLPGLRYNIEINAIGPLGPRCSADDPRCGPLPYAREDAQQAPEWCHDRTPVAGFSPAGACAHDGDCMVTACGNACVSFVDGHGAGICPWYGALEQAYCGCVAGRCRWFE